MRIISQGKTVSVDFDKIFLIQIHDNVVCKISGSQNEDCICLGEYKSEARAQEVFLDIHNAYSAITTYENIIYHMPEK